MARWRSRPVIVLFVLFLVIGVFGGSAVFAGGAGLYWGPVEVAGVRVYMTNPHEGYAGPRVGYTTHVNFHAEYTKAGSYVDLVNLHITRYTSGGQQCMYIWDKISSRPGVVVYDNCKNNWNSVRSEAGERVRSYVNSLGKVTLPLVQYLALVGIMILAIAALLLLMAALPVLILAAPITDPRIGMTAVAWLSSFLG